MKTKAIIFGDSYSTFENFVPAGYPAYYSEHWGETDVRKVEETWWYQVAKELDLNIVLNNSWSGSTICYTAYDNRDCSGDSSFIYRLHELIKSGFFDENEIGKVFVFGGTNDSWADSPVGEVKYGDLSKMDLFSVLPAVCYFFKTLRETLPQAEIYCLINTGLKSEIVDGFGKVCEKYGAIKVTFEKIDKACGHPTVEGMKDIKNAVLAASEQLSL